MKLLLTMSNHNFLQYYSIIYYQLEKATGEYKHVHYCLYTPWYSSIPKINWQTLFAEEVLIPLKELLYFVAQVRKKTD